MHRKIVASAAFWLAGGAVLAGDLDNKAPTGPAIQPLQPLATPTGVTIKPVAFQTDQLPSPQSAPSPAPVIMGEEPVVATAPVRKAPTDDTGRWFGNIDYVLFWMKHNPTPPLVQVLPANLADFNVTGNALPPGAAKTLFGGDGPDGPDHGSFDGARVQLGFYFDDAKCWGVDGSYLQFAQKSENFAIASAGVPVIGRGFHDVGVNEDSFLRYTTPDGLSTGYIRVDAPTQVYTFDANLRAEGPSVLSDRVDYFMGLRYLNLRDSVTIDSGATINNTTGAPPFTITSHEAFKATNEFYASQVGLETHYRWGCFTIEFTGKVAVGWVNQEVRIDGFSTTQTGAAAPVVFPNQSILYVQPSNVGNHSRDKFAIMPEGLVQIGYQITPHIRATVGYDVWDLSSVERSGAAIDTNVNPQMTKYIQVQQPSTVRAPTFSFTGADDWWANGLTLGLEFTY
jgi:Putative beta barrel porin-7 (BBP7)